MIGIEQIKTDVETVEMSFAATQAAADELAVKIEKLQDGTRTADYIEEETKKLKDEYLPLIEKSMGEAGTIAATLEESGQLWSSTEFILSQRAVSPTLGAHPAAPPKDAAVESMMRMSLMGEYSKMNEGLLRIIAIEAKATNQQGRLFLINQELSSRGKEGIDLTDIKIEDQIEALSLLKRAETAKMGAFYVWKTAVTGKPTSPADRINLERMKGARA